MKCIWRRICMIHIHIQEPAQRDNFNINPSALCLLCSEMLHRIIQIFIDGSSAGALLAAFAFFHVSVELFFLPSFLPLHWKHCLCPALSFCFILWKVKPWKIHLRIWGSIFCPGHWNHTKEQDCISLLYAPSGRVSLLCFQWSVPFWGS